MLMIKEIILRILNEKFYEYTQNIFNISTNMKFLILDILKTFDINIINYLVPYNRFKFKNVLNIGLLD